MMDLEQMITASPGQGGHAVVQGARVPAYVLVHALADGASVAEVTEAYGVTELQVRAALACAAGVVARGRVIGLRR
jgi:uncharacterized protein (DUF433 family)